MQRAAGRAPLQGRPRRRSRNSVSRPSELPFATLQDSRCRRSCFRRRLTHPLGFLPCCSETLVGPLEEVSVRREDAEVASIEISLHLEGETSHVVVVICPDAGGDELVPCIEFIRESAARM